MVKLGYKNIDAVDANEAMLEQSRKKGVFKKLICAKLGWGNKLDIPDSKPLLYLKI